MITADSIGVEFGMQVLFQEASFSIMPKDRIALVGRNGAGKSTLLKIIAGQREPSSGVVRRAKGCVIGYLSQILPAVNTNSVMQEVQTVFEHEHEQEKRVQLLNDEIAQRTDYQSQEYADLVELFSHEMEHLTLFKSSNSEGAIEKVLQGLGFVRTDFDRPLSEFSGGWRMRVELAKLLLQSPDVLLLDEPTNHLDIESIYWLEKYLQRSNSAVVLVSHDRTFLNNVTNRTLDISCGKIIDYKVKYDDYVRLSAERREQQMRAYENQQKEIADITKFIERFRYQATKATQVQSRIKQLEKMERVEVDEVDNSSLHLTFPPCSRSGDFPLLCHSLSKKYGEKIVFKGVDLSVKRGEKIAFVGKNGEGKSTMIKCIMGEIDFQGELQLGHNISIGYFAQNQADLLDSEATVYDTISLAARGDMRLKIYDLLGAFLFGQEDFEKKVKVLSGGERTRLAMIKLLLEPVNFLILDEPTNHLDLRTKDVLKHAIEKFDGTVIVVSHDRDFLNGLTDRIYEFGGGKVHEFIGNIYEYLQKKEEEAQTTSTLKATTTSACNKPTSSSTPSKESYEQQKENAKRLRKLQRNVDDAEAKVAELEDALQSIEQQLAELASPPMELLDRYSQLRTDLEKAMTVWEEAIEAIG